MLNSEKQRKENAYNAWLAYHKVQKNLESDFDTKMHKLRIVYEENVRHMSIVSGAIASFSLILFNQQKVDFYPLLLSAGISILLFNVVIGFAHLFNSITKQTKQLLKLKKIIQPLVKMTEISLQCFREKISYIEWSNKDKNFKKTDGEYDKIQKK